MSNLRGFLWSMGRCGTKAIIETINGCTNADLPSWVDTPRFIEAPDYHLALYPRPFALALHFPQHTENYESLLRQYRAVPVVFTVRDPIPNLKSYAKVFLNSYIGRRIDDTAAMVAAGKSIVGTINPSALDQWLLPMVDYWRHWSVIKDSPHMIVDFTDIGEARFVNTLNGICDIFGLVRQKPIVWSGVANTDCDNFLIGYTRTVPILGRNLELRFSRWRDHWGEPGLVTLGVLESSLLDPLIGKGQSLYVHAKAVHLLTAGRIEREREAFAQLLGDADIRDSLAEVVLADHALVNKFLIGELELLEDILIRKFEDSYRSSVEKFLRVHRSLQQKWSSISLPRVA